jgi:hypothetical protein
VNKFNALGSIGNCSSKIRAKCCVPNLNSNPEIAGRIMQKILKTNLTEHRAKSKQGLTGALGWGLKYLMDFYSQYIFA